MKTRLPGLLALPLFALAMLVAVPRAEAQAYPSKPIRMFVGYSAGGAVDIIARVLGQQISASVGQPIVVENKPGANTNIAMRALMDSPSDGYTLMLTANALAANPTLYQPPPFDPARDVTLVSLVGRVPVVLAVNAQSDITSLAQLVAAAKAKPGTITFGTPGNGSTPHLAVELFERAAGISLTHVPYKGGSQAIIDTLSGQIQVVAVNALEVLPQSKAGKLRVVAVMSPGRSPLFPDAPTIAESGHPGFEAAVWYGVIGPANLPPAVVTRMHDEVQKALRTPEVRERLTSAGGEVLPATREQFVAMVGAERARYEKLIREAGIKPD
ncbi:MAG: tripartite tricarboxylate transporter substrate binding protein [Burkholderiales bacterium]|jgi:tripartite-type tricarboxylate transporter receptor subunit TctC|nr:tripartite tricarboxylate transporter substrate binding protein [Burkholderiales bacterium]